MGRSSRPPDREPWFLRFRDLMRFMVREILLVSPAYDAFILEEDGPLDERLFSAYTELSLSSVPRLTHAFSAAGALSLLEERRFDLVITVVHVGDADGGTLANRIKERHPGLPVVLLAFDETDLARLPGGHVPPSVDRTFLWTGDAQHLIAAIKLVEDARNAVEDTRRAGVQVILVVEDSLRRYSAFLGLLYSELMTQSRSLIAEGLNAMHRTIRMRQRPKILLATTYEQAVEELERYGEHLLALVSDIRFPRAGLEDPDAGFALAELARRDHSDLPILLQSAEHGARGRAEAMGAWYCNKRSPTLHAEIRNFLREALGFGDFVFRLPDRTEVGRARDLFELAQVLGFVPAVAVEYHASRNHFSTWLRARGLFALADEVRPLTIAQFESIDALREHVIQELKRELAAQQEGVIADFSARLGSPERPFVRLGRGSVGGKGRSIAFVRSLLATHALPERFGSLRLAVPRTIVIGTDEFARFLEDAGIGRDELTVADDRRITERFLRAPLRGDLATALELATRELRGPLAVRSSSLLEDSRFSSFAGVYATVMLPNDHPDPHVRMHELHRAIQSVWASTFSQSAQSYFASTPHALEDERMAVVIQETIGRRYGDRFYPLLSGIAQSLNHYPVGPQEPEDGVAQIALGLGHGVLHGGTALRFSPRWPEVLPQFASARDQLKSSQSTFWAIDMRRARLDWSAGPPASLVSCDLADAEKDGTLALVGSVYSPSDDVVRDTLGVAGPRLVTFNNILKWGTVPLAPALAELLRVSRESVGGEVEVEFALQHGDTPEQATLYCLQVRPMSAASTGSDESVRVPAVPAERVLCHTGRSLGHGVIGDIRDVVYVPRIPLDAYLTPRIADEIGRMNAALQGEGAPYLLIGPGRWGTADPALGIPVEWPQIAGARVIVETPLHGRPVEPSQGTHFFHNLTASRIGYLAVHDGGAGDERLDWPWLEAQAARSETRTLRHLRLAEPLAVYLDGRHRTATIVR